MQSLRNYKQEKQLAHAFLEQTAIANAYKADGTLSHLVCTLPEAEFYSLYPTWVHCVLFIEGHWLLFHAKEHQGIVQSRLTQARVHIHLRPTPNIYPWNRGEIFFQYHNKLMAKMESPVESLEDFLCNSMALQSLSHTLHDIFDEIENHPAIKAASGAPSIHIFPQKESYEFLREAVNIN